MQLWTLPVAIVHDQPRAASKCSGANAMPVMWHGCMCILRVCCNKRVCSIILTAHNCSSAADATTVDTQTSAPTAQLAVVQHAVRHQTCIAMVPDQRPVKPQKMAKVVPDKGQTPTQCQGRLYTFLCTYHLLNPEAMMQQPVLSQPPCFPAIRSHMCCL